MTDTNRWNRLAGCVSIALLLSACEDNGSLIFVSKTSFALEAGTSPPVATLGFDRYEGYVAPKPPGTQGPSALASFESTSDWFDPSICQVYALGAAAEAIAGAPIPSGPKEYTAPTGNRSAITSISTTTIGLKVGYTTAVVDSISLGYKRLEASYAYLKPTDGEVPSVLMADGFGFAGGANKNLPGKISISQSFAQGLAAYQLAHSANLASVQSYMTRLCPNGATVAATTYTVTAADTSTATLATNLATAMSAGGIPATAAGSVVTITSPGNRITAANVATTPAAAAPTETVGISGATLTMGINGASKAGDVIAVALIPPSN